jgi:LysM repeat protein
MQPGDTLYLVARRFGVRLSELISANPHVENLVSVDAGVSLEIPQAADKPRGFRCLIMHPGRMTQKADGVVVLDYREDWIGVLAHGLPAPSRFSNEVYKVWMRNSVTGGYDIALLYPTPVGSWAARLEARSPLSNYDGVIVTAESLYNDEKPVGPVVISASFGHEQV